MRFVALVLLAGCRLSFDDLGRAATTDAGADADVIVTGGPRAVQTTALLSIDAFASNTVTFPQPTTAGNTIVAYSWTWSSQGPCLLAPSDSAGNTYVQARLGAITGGACAGGNGEVALHVASNVSPTDTITLTRTIADNTAQYALVAVEYAGVDVVVDANSVIASDVSPHELAVSSVETTAPALIASAVTICGGYPDEVVWTAPDLTIRGAELRTNGLAPGAGGESFTTAAGPQSPNWNVTFTGGTSVPVIGVAAALQ